MCAGFTNAAENPGFTCNAPFLACMIGTAEALAKQGVAADINVTICRKICETTNPRKNETDAILKKYGISPSPGGRENKTKLFSPLNGHQLSLLSQFPKESDGACVQQPQPNQFSDSSHPSRAN
mmetsp:Transcript_1269/g.2489  ORF Transcript_1269/g.2489 Transcript_1269/m.2489 type:complete len:124 (-) Transcript_1269:141-512(-)